MPLLLNKPNTENPPPVPLFVGEAIVDLPRIHGVLANQIS